MTGFALFSARNVVNRIPDGATGEDRYVEPFHHGTMSLGMYAPRYQDPQQPHDQDELYFVRTGKGTFVHNEARYPVSEGDSIFVAAGESHNFVDFSDDFTAWVVFWGPPGGEAA